MISMNFVKDYVDLKDENLEELAKKITKAGINVEHVISNHIDNLVIGEVLECEKHPDSDHLNICKVNIGKEECTIVCGASNVRKGLKVIVALPGAILPGEFEIKKSKIRGVESNGMICALFELGLEEKTEETYNKGITELDKDAPVGEDPLEYLELTDTLYDLDVHKHKNNDATNHIGFAYEVGTILGKKVKLPDISYKEVKESINDKFKLEVDTDKCTYYKAKMVTDLVIGESPNFIKNRLTACGMRPINNIVDISNYVMLEFGQPLHFFDYEKLGNKIVVRMAKDNEEIVTLDDKKRDLTSDDIVITDGKKSVCIAGVMGGLNTEVDENTKTVLIESAIFNATNIRKTARRLNLRSEASMRYEKGLNYEFTDMAIERACHLLEKYASGKVLEGNILYDKEDKKEKKISFTREKINSLLGLELTDDDIKEELGKLDFKYVFKNNKFDVVIPRRRLDIDENINDIAEEIGRLYGYHNLKNSLPVLPTRPGKYDDSIAFRKSISKRMRSLGLDETRTYTLTSEKKATLFNKDKELVKVPNPMSSDRSVLRKTIIPSLLDVIKYNKSRGLKNINIYEISKVFFDDFKEENYLAVSLYGNYIESSWSNSKVKNDFYVIKGICESLLDYLGLKNRYSFEKSDEESLHPGISANILLDKKKVGYLGKIHPLVSKDDIYVLELSIDKLMVKTKGVKFKPASKYPAVNKDLAFIVNKDITSKEVEEVIKKAGGRLLTDVKVFDVYTGDKLKKDEKSLAYSLTFQDLNRTLTEEEVTGLFENIIKNVCDKFKATLRDK
ncbi:MAG: phenylalanine--tRNA ligase subunit beta [Bacilli bacterium]|nr:phenylalanine--tRNA ligase subunit beta [Bacilli bacterium]